MLTILTALGMLAAVQDRPPSAPDAACVAIVLPSVEGVDNSTAVATSVRALFLSYLTGPSLRSIALDARLTSQAAQEATQKQCTTLLTMSMTRKAGGSGKTKVATVADAAGTVAGYIPGSGVAEIAVAGAAVSGHAIGSLAASTRAKDEMRIEYRLTTVDGAQVMPPKTESRKAQSNGEDIVTPLVERAANAIAFVVTKK